MPRRTTTRLRLTALEDRLTPAGGLDGLDPAFGAGGRVALRPATPAPPADPDVTSVIGLPGAKSLVVGRLDGLFVQRLNADGTPDAAFGVGGRAGLKDSDLPNPQAGPVTLGAAAATPDGGVLVVGTSNAFTADGLLRSTLRVFKLTAAGALDAAYMANANAAGGFAPRADGAPGGNDGAAGVVAAADGSAVVAGATGDAAAAESGDARRAAVLRLRADGTPDAAFGVGGRVAFGPGTVTDAATSSVLSSLSAVALDAGGRVLVAGTAFPRPGLNVRGVTNPVLGLRAFAARLTAAGVLDASFDGDGVAAIAPPAGPTVKDVTGDWVGPGPAGAVVVGLGGGRGRFSTVRLTEGGAPDAAYGVGGFSELTSATGPLQPAVGVVIGPAGVTLVATLRTVPGQAAGPTPGAADTPDSYLVALEQVAQDGKSVDRVGEIRLAGDGEAVTARPKPAVAIDPQGRVTVAGGVLSPSDPRVVVARLAVGPPRVVVDPPIVPPAVVPPPNPPVVVTVPPRPAKVPGDVDGDGVADKVVLNGPRLSVTSGKDGSVLVPSFAPFEASYTGPLNAVFVDADGDGRPELVVGPGLGGGPVVAVYNADGTERGRFWGLDDAGFRGGVNLAAGDVDADGRPDLIVAAGAGGGPRVAIFDGESLATTPTRLVADFFAFEDSQRGGATAGLANGVLVFGAGPGGGPRVRGVDARGLLAAAGVKSLDDLPAGARKFDRFAGDSASRQGVKLDFSGVEDSVTAPRGKVKADSGDGKPEFVYIFEPARTA